LVVADAADQSGQRVSGRLQIEHGSPSFGVKVGPSGSLQLIAPSGEPRQVDPAAHRSRRIASHNTPISHTGVGSPPEPPMGAGE